MPPKRLRRYVNEFDRRHNIRDTETIDPMREWLVTLVGKRLL